MDDSRFDHLTRSLATGASRRSVIKALLGLGGTAAMGSTLLDGDADAARRPPNPTPTPVKCPGKQIASGGQCVCPNGLSKCGPDCCNPAGVGSAHSVCCDNACCFGTCYGEELCCPTNAAGTAPPTHLICQTTTGPECCPTGTPCCAVDGCCDGDCFGGATGEDFCCPADGGSVCAGGGVTSCCTGDTPKCCNVLFNQPPICRRDDQCCESAECSDLTDPLTCVVGVCDDDFVCSTFSKCDLPDGAGAFCCPGGSEEQPGICCDAGELCCDGGTNLNFCRNPATGGCCEDADCVTPPPNSGPCVSGRCLEGHCIYLDCDNTEVCCQDAAGNHFCAACCTNENCPEFSNCCDGVCIPGDCCTTADCGPEFPEFCAFHNCFDNGTSRLCEAFTCAPDEVCCPGGLCATDCEGGCVPLVHACTTTEECCAPLVCTDRQLCDLCTAEGGPCTSRFECCNDGLCCVDGAGNGVCADAECCTHDECGAGAMCCDGACIPGDCCTTSDCGEEIPEICAFRNCFDNGTSRLCEAFTCNPGEEVCCPGGVCGTDCEGGCTPIAHECTSTEQCCPPLVCSARQRCDL